MVAGVGDDRVGGAEDRPQRADVGLVAGGEDDRVLGPLPVGDLLLELEVQRRRAVEQARARQARAVALERVARALDDALVAREPQVVVGAEHDPRGALHLDDRARRALDGAEVGDDVGLARGAQQGHALVVAGLGKDVDRGLGHVGCAAVSVDVRPVEGRKELREFIELPYRLHSTSPYWIPPLRIERRLFLSRRQNAFFKHGDAQLFCAWRDGRVVGRISAQIDHAFNDYQDNRWGMFGFLEFEDDPEVLPALLAAAEGWLRARGRDLMIGPMDFGDQRRERRARRGLRPRADDQAALAPALLRGALRGGRPGEGHGPVDVGARHRRPRRRSCRSCSSSPSRSAPSTACSIRKMSRRSLRRDMDRFAEVYNSAWAQNWGFYAVLQGGPRLLGPEMQLVFDAPWFMVAEKDGETVGGGDHDPGHQPGAQAR